jgi:site-specific DNA-cytosine methylase
MRFEYIYMAYVNVCISACTYVLEIVQQQVPVKLVDAIEFNSECLTSLRCLRPGVTYTGCKTANGLDLENPVIKVRNLLTHPSDKLHTCDLFFAGWPCPPFSTLGARRGDDDIRILVFKKVCVISRSSLPGTQVNRSKRLCWSM